MNIHSAKSYMNMLESLLEHVDNNNDKVFIEGALEGFMALIEGSMHVEFAPIMGKMLPSRYVPSEADTEEVISRGKKTYRSKLANPTPDDVIRDTIMWIYGALTSRDKDTIDDDFAKMILFNPNPEVTATGFENYAIKPVTGNLSTHPLWSAIKNEMSSILTTSDDPYFKYMRSRLETKMANDERSYNHLKKTNQLGMEKIEKVNKLTDTFKSARNTGYVDDIAADKEAQRKAQSDQVLKDKQASIEKRIAAENERKAKLANLSIADIATKFSEKPTRSIASIDDMKSKMAKEEEEKAARRRKWDEMFAS